MSAMPFEVLSFQGSVYLKYHVLHCMHILQFKCQWYSYELPDVTAESFEFCYTVYICVQFVRS